MTTHAHITDEDIERMLLVAENSHVDSEMFKEIQTCMYCNERYSFLSEYYRIVNEQFDNNEPDSYLENSILKTVSNNKILFIKNHYSASSPINDGVVQSQLYAAKNSSKKFLDGLSVTYSSTDNKSLIRAQKLIQSDRINFFIISETDSNFAFCRFKIHDDHDIVHTIIADEKGRATLEKSISLDELQEKIEIEIPMSILSFNYVRDTSRFAIKDYLVIVSTDSIFLTIESLHRIKLNDILIITKENSLHIISPINDRYMLEKIEISNFSKIVLY